MSKQIITKHISFRLQDEAYQLLKQIPEHTKWVQQLVLMNLGICPLCNGGNKRARKLLPLALRKKMPVLSRDETN